MPTETKAPDVPGMVEFHRDLIRRGDFEKIGRVKCIVIDPEAQGNMPAKKIADVVGRRLDFYGAWPLIAQSRDHSALLLVGHQWGPAFKRRDGSVGLPDIPDLSWARPAPTAAEMQDPNYRAPDPPMLKQSLGDRSRGAVPANGTRYLVCGPVAQIFVKPDGIARGILIHAFAGGPDSRHMEVFIDQATGEGFLLFGRYEINMVG